MKNNLLFQYGLYLLGTFGAFIITEAFNPNGSLSSQNETVIVVLIALGIIFLGIEYSKNDAEKQRDEQKKQQERTSNRIELYNKSLFQIAEQIGRMEQEIDKMQGSDNFELLKQLISIKTKFTKLQRNMNKVERGITESDNESEFVLVQREGEPGAMHLSAPFTLADIRKQINLFEDELIDFEGKIQEKQLSYLNEVDRSTRLSDEPENASQNNNEHNSPNEIIRASKT